MSSYPTALQDDTIITRGEDESFASRIRVELSDRQLVESVLAGDETAFEQIFDRYKRLVASIASRYFRQPQQIEEIIQITFAKVFFDLKNFRGEHELSLAGWLGKIAATSCLDVLRNRKRKPENLLCELSDAEGRVIFEHAGSDASSENALIDRDLAEKLLAGLPPEDRALLQMLYAEDMSVSEAAAALGWSKSKIKVRAWRARNKLRKVLKRYM